MSNVERSLFAYSYMRQVYDNFATKISLGKGDGDIFFLGGGVECRRQPALMVCFSALFCLSGLVSCSNGILCVH